MGTALNNSTGTMEALCEDLTLNNLVIMINCRWDGVAPSGEGQLELDLSHPDGFVRAVAQRGAKIYRCSSASDPDLGALRIILGGRSIAREAQQEPIDKGSEPEQTAVRQAEPSGEKPESGEKHNSDIRELAGSTQEAVDKEVKELRRKLEEQKKELDEQQRRAQEEAEVFKERIVEMQSKLEEDRHGSGKTSSTYLTFDTFLPVRVEYSSLGHAFT